MARLPIPGSDEGEWGDILNEFLRAEHNEDGTLKPTGTISEKYTKPTSGIPASDLSAAAQTSLGKADTAEQAANKGAASGYAALDSGTKVPTAQLGGSGASASTFLRGDQTWVAPPSGTPASTVATETAYGQASAVGSASEFARADHTHGTPPTPSSADILANRPAAAAANSGLLFFASDVNGGTLYRSNGSVWTQVASGLTQVTAHTDAAHSDGPNVHQSVVDAKGDLIVATAADTVARKAVGSNGQALVADSAESDGLKWADIVTTAPFSRNGVLAVTTGTTRYYVDSNATITGVRASVNTAPTGASLIVDVNIGGTTIYTTQGNRPTITAGNNTATANNPDVTSIAAGDYLTVDIDQVGPSVAGSDLVVQVHLRRT